MMVAWAFKFIHDYDCKQLLWWWRWSWARSLTQWESLECASLVAMMIANDWIDCDDARNWACLVATRVAWTIKFGCDDTRKRVLWLRVIKFNCNGDRKSKWFWSQEVSRMLVMTTIMNKYFNHNDSCRQAVWMRRWSWMRKLVNSDMLNKHVIVTMFMSNQFDCNKQSHDNCEDNYDQQLHVQLQ
jgi:hypothetical protein